MSLTIQLKRISKLIMCSIIKQRIGREKVHWKSFRHLGVILATTSQFKGKIGLTSFPTHNSIQIETKISHQRDNTNGKSANDESFHSREFDEFWNFFRHFPGKATKMDRSFLWKNEIWFEVKEKPGGKEFAWRLRFC